MTDKPTSAKLAEIAFGEALNSLQTKAAEINEDANQSSENKIADGALDKLIAAFEDAAEIDGSGEEYWDAHKLQKLLDYNSYEDFLVTLSKAKEACRNSGFKVEDHFVAITNASAPTFFAETVRLSRYACYLTAQNGDTRKQPIAFAQTYFAIQARRQEVQDEDYAQYTPLVEDEKRVLLREEIKIHNKKLASAAKSAGVVQPLDFAIFQNAGYQGLYGGLDRSGIQRRKGIKAKQNILDYMGSTELAANLFRATQTEEKLRRDKISSKEAANATHNAVGKKVRQAIADLGGTMPEHLPKAENIVKVGKRLKNAISGSAN